MSSPVSFLAEGSFAEPLKFETVYPGCRFEQEAQERSIARSCLFSDPEVPLPGIPVTAEVRSDLAAPVCSDWYGTCTATNLSLLEIF
jgi:hypothetical protein